ncbi:PREDICTED: uncharacterized protein LOC109583593 isoform X2 [Amphimedon queenslandica]|uniref:Uncharacterized protein n=1 Tax=Amphimedon queenslandica TaxID=400682 RepID=A0AAN0JCR1_AMPQE|nr:PREDICTED: uncharacterized protein LOC109583593 isoform X2 [Amphimedon queenslandica]|eukprot:XP_019854567.1 PREDICTED: uncharacterized protein LOC109583593 isoform X2 [Amphimedon queenslandica]
MQFNGRNLIYERETTLTGGGVRIIQIHNAFVIITMCKFVNNSATFVGGSLYMNFSDAFQNAITIYACNFTSSIAGISGGAIGITVYLSGSLPPSSNYSISFRSCNIINNVAQFGGGVAIQIPRIGVRYQRFNIENSIRFHKCTFMSNIGKVTSAVDINGQNQRVEDSLHTLIVFQTNTQFKNNIAGFNLQVPQHRPYKGKLFSATVYAIDAQVSFESQVTFINNTGTPVYLKNSHSRLGFKSNVSFIGNTGDRGGAILLDEYSVIELDSSSLLQFINNSALIGGAIFVDTINIIQYEGICFFQKVSNYRAFYIRFKNNIAESGIGHDIFVTTLQPCVQLHHSNATALFTGSKIGIFNFSSSVSQAISTAPATLLLNKTELNIFPYPGLPYAMNVTQIDEFNKSVTNLQLFPLSSTWLQKSTIKINSAHSIGHSYILTFNGQVGQSNILLLQGADYSATLYINVTLYQCPPGYIFQNDTCLCSHSTSLYYNGILHCLEDKRAVIAKGFWAGYLKDKFTTATCPSVLCNYTNDKKYEEHVLPLNCSLLNDHVCASHRNGVLCGSCVTGYTTYLHSPSYHCGESAHCKYGPLFYILSEIIPVTIIFLVILLFNINLTSGALYSFIFYSQIVSNHYTQYQPYSDALKYFFSTLKVVYGIFDLSILEVNEFSFCLFKNATVMDLMLIKYLTTLYALLLIFVTILVLRANSLYFCIKLCHKCGRRNIRGSIVNALTAFLVLFYFRCLVITLYVLVPSYVIGEGGNKQKTVPLYNGDLSYMSNDHLNYVIPAMICLAFIIIPPPIILLSEPFIVRINGALNIKRNAVTYNLHRLRMKLKPFLDSFQGCFKDNYRCFAGLFLLYHILIVLTPMYFSEGTFWNITIKGTLLFLILLLHCLCSPFQQNIFNHLNSFLLINLLLINMLQLALVSTYDGSVLVAGIIQLALMSLPLIYLLCYTTGWLCKNYCVQRRRYEIDHHADGDEFPARMIPGLLESYNTFN